MNRKKIIKTLAVILVIALAITMIVSVIKGIASKKEIVEEISYSEAMRKLESGEINKITLYKDTSKVKMASKVEKRTVYIATVPDFEYFTQQVMWKIERNAKLELESDENIEFDVKTSTSSALNAIVAILSIVLPIVLVIIALNFLSKRLQDLTDGKDEFEKIEKENSTVRFSDVAGLDEEISEIRIVIDFLHNPEAFKAAGAKVPKGILFEGKPGTGKTLLAKAIAGEAGVDFFYTTASSFEEKYVGVGASRIRRLFAEARKCAPAIIFIDEIDSLMESRYSGHGYNEQTLNQFLAELDGFSDEEGIIVIGATNHAEVLDEAAVRAGRFDKKIHIPTPSRSAREGILWVHARNKMIGSSVSFENLAKKTAGFTGAELANLLNEAVLTSIKRGGGGLVESIDIDEALATILLGVGKSNEDSNMQARVAVHEAGHALVSRIVNPELEIYEISVKARGKAGGYNLIQEPDDILITESQLKKKIDVLLGGRIAEKIVFGDISTGAENDLARASQIAYDMVVKYAMGNGPQLTRNQVGHYNEELDKMRFEQIQKIVQEETQNVSKVISDNAIILRNLAIGLTKYQVLEQNQIDTFFKKSGI